MSRISRGNAEEKANRPFARVLRSLLAEPPVTSQAQLAEILGKTQQAIGQYVSGKSEPGYDVLIEIADHFQVSVDYLLGRSKHKTTDMRTQTICNITGINEDSILLLFDHTEGINPAESVAAEAVNDFISYALAEDQRQRFPVDMYHDFRTAAFLHQHGDLAGEEDEPVQVGGCFTLSLDDVADLSRTAFCNGFNEYLKNKYQLEVTKNGND